MMSHQIDNTARGSTGKKLSALSVNDDLGTWMIHNVRLNSLCPHVGTQMAENGKMTVDQNFLVACYGSSEHLQGQALIAPDLEGVRRLMPAATDVHATAQKMINGGTEHYGVPSVDPKLCAKTII